MASLTQINSNLLSSFSLGSISTIVGYLILAIVVVGAIGWFLWWYYSKKKWNKQITLFESVGDRFEPTFRDKGCNVKIGQGGFEVLWWQKAKKYSISFGQRIGKNSYYFAVAPDGYQYNFFLGNKITTDGRIPIITSNPTMRSQYTALEKTIEALHGQKKSFMEKYGSWVFSIAFILIAGLIMWFMVRDIPNVLTSMSALVDKMTTAVTEISNACTALNPSAAHLAS